MCALYYITFIMSSYYMYSWFYTLYYFQFGLNKNAF